MVTSSSNSSGESAGYDPRRGVWSPGGILSDIADIQIKHEVMDTTDALENSNYSADGSMTDASSPGGSLLLPEPRSPGLDSTATSSRGASPHEAIDAMNAMVAQNKRRRLGNNSGNKGKSPEEEVCLICGDRASGYHYNALSCEGCKGFFRRSITRGSTYQCKYGGNCEMDMWMRRRCQACRLKRCREVGMKEECLLSEEQCKARDVRRKARQTILRSSKEEATPAPDSNTPSIEKKAGPPIVNENPLDALSVEHRELIEKLVTSQDKYELPSEEDIARLANVKIKDREEPSELTDAIYKQMANVTIMVTQLVVEFAKHLPGFMTLNRDDQIVLLKGSSCEIMMIRTARRYDIETDTIVFADGMPYTRDSLRFAGLHDYVDSMFHYCGTMGKLAVDNAEYALLTAITLFSVRPGVKDIRKVEEIQEMYARVLESYDKARRGPGTFFAKLLVSLVELRTLSCAYSDVLFKLRVEKGSLPPLLCEYFDVVD